MKSGIYATFLFLYPRIRPFAIGVFASPAHALSMSDEIEQAIEDAARSGIASVTVDGQTVQGHRIGDLIDADKYLAEKAKKSSRPTSIHIGRFIPPGMADDPA